MAGIRQKAAVGFYAKLSARREAVCHKLLLLRDMFTPCGGILHDLRRNETRLNCIGFLPISVDE